MCMIYIFSLMAATMKLLNDWITYDATKTNSGDQQIYCCARIYTSYYNFYIVHFTYQKHKLKDSKFNHIFLTIAKLLL